MSRRYSPTVRRRRLSAVLRQLRHDHGGTLESVSSELEWSRGRLAHMEGNKWTRPDLGNIKQLMDHYEVKDHTRREAILRLARQSRERGWWAKFKDVLGSGTLEGFETEASVISTYQPTVIPGLLQTQGYANASARATLTRPSEEVQRRVQARMARQEILGRGQGPIIWAVVDESTLYRIPKDDGAAADQIQHLITTAADPDNDITIQVLPFAAGLHPGISGPFVIMDFPDSLDSSIVYLESRTDGLFLEEHEEVDEYRLVFDHLQVTALSQAESIRTMKKIHDNL